MQSNNKDTSVIPKDTPYCYKPIKYVHGNTIEESHLKIETCPYWNVYFDEENWDYIYCCHYLDVFDYEYDLSLIWDQVKLCGISRGYGDDE